MKLSAFWDFVISLLAVIISALLFSTALPPHNAPILGLIALTPLFAAFRTKRPLISAGAGLVCGFISCYIASGGKIENISQYANLLAAFGMLSITIAFCNFCSSLASNKMGPVQWAFTTACGGAGGVYLLSNAFPANVAVVLSQNPFALRLASIVGVWGATFLVWFVPTCIISAFLLKKRAYLMAVPVVLILALSLLMRFPDTNGSRIAVAAIQAPDAYNASDETDKISDNTKIVVWPEILMDPSEDMAYKSAKKNNVYIVGSFLEREANKEPQNVVYLISPSGKNVGRSEKAHLFGKETFIYKKGVRVNAANAGSIKIGMPVCFDAMFTDITLNLARHGAKMLFIPNSDPDIPNGCLCILHAATVAFRSAETGSPIIWAESMNFSTIYDGNGQRLTMAPQNSITHVTANVTLPSGTTIYTRIGDVFPLLCTAAFVIMITIGIRTHIQLKKKMRKMAEEKRLDNLVADLDRINSNGDS